MSEADRPCINHVEVRLNAQVALLEFVTPTLRAVNICWSSAAQAVHFDAFVDGPIGLVDEELLGIVNCELGAQFSDAAVTHSVIRLDFPERIPEMQPDEGWDWACVYCRFDDYGNEYGRNNREDLS